DTEIGYLHRCFEKMAETHVYWQVIPYTDRLNYMSAMMNGVTYAMTVEKMFGVEIPKRAQYIRVILSEFSRIADHLVCIGTNLVAWDEFSNFWYGSRPVKKSTISSNRAAVDACPPPPPASAALPTISPTTSPSGRASSSKPFQNMGTTSKR